MKHVFIVLVVLCLAAGAAFAEGADVPRVSIGGVGFLGYSAILPGLNLYNLRVGAGLDAMVNISSLIGIGVEAGIGYGLTNPFDGVGYFEIPVRGTVTVRLNGILLQPFGGACFCGITTGSGTSTSFTTAFEAGARVGLVDKGFIFAEVSRVFGAVSFWRYGLGARMAFLNF